ncbi:MAG: type II toxin-antitoxin system HicA family toxin [Pirellulaceae bacterium]
MSKIAGVNHLNAVRALEKAGFTIVRQGKHIVMTDGKRQVTIPRHNPIKAFTLGGIVQDAGLTVEDFRKLL